MSQASKEYLKAHAQFERVELKDGTEHELEFINDKIDTIEDKNTKKEIEGVKYLFKEGGDLKTVFTTSRVLIEKMSDIETNDKVKIQQVKYQGNNGQELTTYNVSKLEGKKWITVGEVKEIETEELPTINGDEMPIVEDDPKMKGEDEEMFPVESIPF